MFLDETLCIFSPLEQFDLFPLLNTPLLVFTNMGVTLFLVLIFYCFYINLFNKGNLIPTRIQTFFELIYNTVFGLAFSNIGNRGFYVFPLIFVTFVFILFYNLIGMIPYSFTITSHLIVTFALALMLFIGLNIIGVQQHKIKFLSLLLPNGASIFLVPLLVPIELVSYMFRVVSLPVRLFANMMAGHTLLKVIAGFSWVMVSISGFMFILHFIPLGILVLLIGLELGVATIQAYVFTILICMYINDSLNLH